MTLRHRIVQQLHLGPLSFILLCALLAALIVNAGPDPVGLHVGQRVSRAIVSRVTFSMETGQTETARLKAWNDAPSYFMLDAELLNTIRERLTQTIAIAGEPPHDPQQLREAATELDVPLDETGAEYLVRTASQPAVMTARRSVERVLEELKEQPLVEPEDDLASRRLGHAAVLVDDESIEREYVPRQVGPDAGVIGGAAPDSKPGLLFASKAADVKLAVENAIEQAVVPEALRASFRNALLTILRVEGTQAYRPLYRYNAVLSDNAAEAAAQEVVARETQFRAGNVIAAAGIIGRGEIERLEAEHRAYRARIDAPLDVPDPETLSPQERQQLAYLRAAHSAEIWSAWSRGIIAFLVVFALGGYILIAHPEATGRTQRRLATGLTFLVVLALARIAYAYTPYVHLAVGIYAFAVALLVITTKRGHAYTAAGLLALMMALTTRQGVGFVAILTCVALTLFLGLRDLRHRGRIIVTGAGAAGVALLTTSLVGFIAGQSFGFVFWHQAIWATLTTLGAAFIVEGILPGIERLFGVTTNMTLLEWCDPNKALLRMLAAESPGTYNHSLLVGTLAGAAADAINANGLLARAGAYYHDIGKINKPAYFVENQAMGVGNRHERLSPAMSHLVIIGHVKDGVEMAKEYGLPESLRAFIPEHHGTCVVEYFYHAASQARKPGDPEISDTEFRYPGPKPRSRETAIVMLCDGVEGAVRAMPEPTPNRIEDTVERIVQKRMMDGQFDECELTFRELNAIRASLVKNLSSMYHGRIAYPSASKEKDKEKKEERTTRDKAEAGMSGETSPNEGEAAGRS